MDADQAVTYPAVLPGGAQGGAAIGDLTGIELPACPATFRAAGAPFLTRAFRAFGSLGPDNAVARIIRCEDCPGGSTGKKLFLSIAYERSDPALHTELFVKFSRDFDDRQRDDRGKHEMQGEIALAALSRRRDFPVTVCAAYFADHDAVSKTGILITERVGFGVDGIEPHHRKCMDYLIDDPLDHYRALVRSLALIAAADRGADAEIDIAFPYDPDAAAAANPIPFAEPVLTARIRAFGAFAATHRRLYPISIAPPELFAAIEREAPRFLAHQEAVRRFLQGDRRLVALCHWNANIDNAWFWRDDAGVLRCGLIDWGSAGRMNMAFALWGCLCSATPALWSAHLDDLLALFVAKLHAHGGPRIDPARLTLHLDLYAMLMGLSYFIDAPSRIAHRLPGFEQATGERDPMFEGNESARNQLNMSKVFLKLWRMHDLDTVVDRMMAHPAVAP